MIRFLPVIVAVILTIYTALDCLMTDERELRNAPKWAWLLLILFFPVVGAVSYLVAGRAVGVRSTPQVKPSRPLPIAPDDDPTFLASLRELNVSHEHVLEEWEADLRRREQELRDKEPHPDDPEAEPGPAER